jgi:23S rRNA pseudouridine1911/1915/1917 synthase
MTPRPLPLANEVCEFVFRGEPTRLDQAIAASLADVSRGRARRLIDAGSAFVEGRRCRIASRIVRAGERVRVVVAETPGAVTLRVLYEDDDVIVVDKPSGMATAPTRQAAAGTVHEALRGDLRRRGGGEARLWVVHRLDAATSGVVAFARNAAAARALSRAFQEQLVEKRYVALVSGGPERDEGRIDSPIEVLGGRARVSERGKAASTSWRVRTRGEHDTLLELEPRTGRMHQLRVHLAALGHPVVGDRLYGGGAASRLMLHAEGMRFPHPRSGERIEVCAALPAEIRCGGSVTRDGDAFSDSARRSGGRSATRSRETPGRSANASRLRARRPPAPPTRRPPAGTCR